MTSALKSVTVPSKTFVFGEYAVLDGAPALIFASKPQFKFLFKEGGQLGFHPESPAGRFLIREGLKPILKDLTIVDPHQGQGGFGGSTAEFLAAYAFVKGRWKTLSEVWQAYRECCQNSKGVAPSGADLVAQVMGGFTVFQMNPFRGESGDWPFLDLEVLFVRTGAKVKTHEHLAGLSLHVKDLCQLSESLLLSLRTRDSEQFCHKLGLYQKELRRLNLVAESTKALLDRLQGQKGLLVAKGCGAMGADVMMLVLERGMMEKMKVIVQSMGLSPVATHADQSLGASVEWLAQGSEVGHVV